MMTIDEARTLIAEHDDSGRPGTAFPWPEAREDFLKVVHLLMVEVEEHHEVDVEEPRAN